MSRAAGWTLARASAALVGVEATGEKDGKFRMAGDKLTGDGPVECFSGAAVVFACRRVDEEGETFVRGKIVREILGADSSDDRNVLVEEVVDVFAGFVPVKLHHVDESFVEKLYGEWSGIVDKDTHAEDFSFHLKGECAGEFGRAVSFGGGPEIDSERIHF